MRACQRPSRRLRTSSLRRQSTGALLPMYAATLNRTPQNETPINPDEILVLDPFPRDMFRKAGVFMHRLIAPCDSPRAVAWKCE